LYSITNSAHGSLWVFLDGKRRFKAHNANSVLFVLFSKMKSTKDSKFKILSSKF